MKKYDLLILGFGKGGKTLAKIAASNGKKVAVVEQSKQMYGGTCINIGCIPSKTLVHEGLVNNSFKQALARKEAVVSALNHKNYHNLVDDENISVLDYKARFKSNKVIELLNKKDEIIDTITAEYIVINTGAIPIIPNIEGVEKSKFLYDSSGIMNLKEQPKRLVIVGGGYISLEFASIFANFGTKVTVIESHNQLMPREDEEVVTHVVKDLEDKGVKFEFNTQTYAFEDRHNDTVVKTNKGQFEADAVLLATGRKPNIDLSLENTDITLGEQGEIKVNKYLETAVEHVFAIGDVKGGMQFTYISLDDFRIVNDRIYGLGNRSTENRGVVPYTVFLDPPLSRVGLTAKEARAQGYKIKEGTLPVNHMPRHKINNDGRGIFKVVIDEATHKILGATLYGMQSEELINIIKLAIDQDLDYTVLRDSIYTHPTMIESFNDLFNI